MTLESEASKEKRRQHAERRKLEEHVPTPAEVKTARAGRVAMLIMAASITYTVARFIAGIDIIFAVLAAVGAFMMLLVVRGIGR